MIVDTLFVLSVAMLIKGDEIPDMSVQVYQTLHDCHGYRATLVDKLKELKKVNPRVDFYLSDCTPTPVEKVK